MRFTPKNEKVLGVFSTAELANVIEAASGSTKSTFIDQREKDLSLF